MASIAQAPPISAGLDKTSQAAVGYLTTGSVNDFNHLVAICLRAKGNLCILPFDQENKTTGKAKQNDSIAQATKKWVEVFVLEFLKPFHNATADEVRAAAAQDKFRYMGRRCRLRMIDEIRQRYTAKSTELRLSEDQSTVMMDNWVGQPLESAERSSLGYSPVFATDELEQALQENQKEFEELLGKTLLAVLQVECKAYLDGTSKGDTTRAVAERLHVKIGQARRYRNKLREKMAGALKINAAVQELYGLLLQGSQRSVLHHSRLSINSKSNADDEELDDIGEPEPEKSVLEDVLE